MARVTESVSMGAPISVALIGPQEDRRKHVADAFSGPQSRVAREFAFYPAFDDLARILEAAYDVVLVDLDADPEKALEIVEHLGTADASLTVMVFSGRMKPDLLVRCMRAGAREFLSEPVVPGAVAEAVVRATVRRDEARRVRKTAGGLYVFVGAKGGAGVTTMAANFALGLAKEVGSNVALLDLNLHLGDAGLTLGVTSKYSVTDALEGVNRLDSDFLSAIMARHSSGLAVLCAPDAVSNIYPDRNAVEKLLRVAREVFDYVVVDAGHLPTDVCQALFEAATSVYLITQVAIPELRNANRILTRHFSGARAGKVEIVLNRYDDPVVDIEDASVTKALTRPAKWKISNDPGTARHAQNTAVPFVLTESALGRQIRNMARVAGGLSPLDQKKKRFGMFGV